MDSSLRVEGEKKVFLKLRELWRRGGKKRRLPLQDTSSKTWPRNVELFPGPRSPGFRCEKMPNAYKSARLQLKFAKPHLEHVLKAARSGSCCSSEEPAGNKEPCRRFLLAVISRCPNSPENEGTNKKS